ncbi:uncharacterized protein BYT42DRAFT_542836 [Radiomyces spectabilis]|uniref:uncharacterized protein n=1 Tax=Radiomyces spectabilis TaxID=64574 RepID=UPI00221EA221|nr:uncharacterized protein BYT42DRAFT_542836 [Radiomyces spectabilis]KAI8391248.1 hypothetical protein BYT42DRAFT_542836 [Radiomyces spectabilis]
MAMEQLSISPYSLPSPQGIPPAVFRHGAITPTRVTPADIINDNISYASFRHSMEIPTHYQDPTLYAFQDNVAHHTQGHQGSISASGFFDNHSSNDFAGQLNYTPETQFETGHHFHHPPCYGPGDHQVPKQRLVAIPSSECLKPGSVNPIPLTEDGQLSSGTELQKPFEPTPPERKALHIDTTGLNIGLGRPHSPSASSYAQSTRGSIILKESPVLRRRGSKEEVPDLSPSVSTVPSNERCLTSSLLPAQEQQICRSSLHSPILLSPTVSVRSGRSTASVVQSSTPNTPSSGSVRSDLLVSPLGINSHSANTIDHSKLVQRHSRSSTSSRSRGSPCSTTLEHHPSITGKRASPLHNKIPSPWTPSSSSPLQLYEERLPSLDENAIHDVTFCEPSTRQVPNQLDEDLNNESSSGIKSRLSIASFSLTQDKTAIKTYRRMAIKTRSIEVQMAYTKYLFEIANLYHQGKNEKRTTTASTIRHRLLAEAGFWIEKLAKAGHPEALYIKGCWHLHPHSSDCVGVGYDKVNLQKAFRCLQAAAKAGWSEANFELALCWKKRGNFAKAVACYKNGASKGHTLCTYKLAKIFLRGQLQQKRNVTDGLTWLKKAADAQDCDSAEAAFVLSCIYANQFDCISMQRDSSFPAQDDSLSLQYLRKAVNLGYIDAIYRMGHIYKQGALGQPCDPWQGFQYFVKAAEKDHEGAKLELSAMYMEGIRGYLAPQHDMAYKWCTSAADGGCLRAQYMLGTYYEEGIGVSKDYARALEFFSKAASMGYQPAAEKLNRPVTMPAKTVATAKSAQVDDEIDTRSTPKKSDANCFLM